MPPDRPARRPSSDLTTTGNPPVIIGQRLRKGACGSPGEAKQIVSDALAMTRFLLGSGTRVLLRADPAFYGEELGSAARTSHAPASANVDHTKPRLARAAWRLPSPR